MGESVRPSGADARRSGIGRVLIAVYAVFALGATSRAAVQLLTKFSQAPLAYSLSAFAGVVYCVATYALASRRGAAWRLAVAAITVELVGVLAIGTASILDEAAFPDETVWSGFGKGYGYVPVVLPLVGLWWLRRTRVRPGVSDGER